MALPEDIEDDVRQDEYREKYQIPLCVKISLTAWVNVEAYEDADGEIDEDELLRLAMDNFYDGDVEFDLSEATLEDWQYDD